MNLILILQTTLAWLKFRTELTFTSWLVAAFQTMRVTFAYS